MLETASEIRRYVEDELRRVLDVGSMWRAEALLTTEAEIAERHVDGRPHDPLSTRHTGVCTPVPDEEFAGFWRCLQREPTLIDRFPRFDVP